MNKLKHLAEFREVLSDYQPSARAMRVLRGTKLILLVGPSSSGRNTVIREMVKQGGYHFAISDTTRAPRIENGKPEKNGVHYWFRTEEDMLADLKSGDFAGASIVHGQQVSGISIREIQIALVKRAIPITDIEVMGAAYIHKIHPQSTCIFVVPPSYEEWQRRLSLRGHMDPEEYERRMLSAKQELTTALKANYYHFVVNEDSHETVEIIKRLVDGDFQQSVRKNARKVAEELLAALLDRQT